MNQWQPSLVTEPVPLSLSLHTHTHTYTRTHTHTHTHTHTRTRRDQRPPSLVAEEVAPLPEGYGGHREGGWEAIAGTGSSWGERSVAAIAHENSAVVKQVGVRRGGVLL